MNKKIKYYPVFFGVNKYSERIINLLEKENTVKSISFKQEFFDFIRFKKNYNNDAVIVNWLDNGIINSDNGKISVVGLIKTTLVLIILKIRYKKLIYVRHNMYPHDTAKKFRPLAKWFVELFCYFSDECVSHSPRLKNSIYIPHPLYKYPLKEGIYNHSSIKKDKALLIFGRIERYKKIDKLIELFPSDKKLVVAGACDDSIYLEKLNKLASTKLNVKIIADYLPDEQVSELFSNCSAILLCHADDDMIVSGSFFYALTEQLSILAIKTPFLEWAESELSSDIIKTFNDIPQMIEFIDSNKSIYFRTQGFDSNHIKRINNLFGDESIKNALRELIEKK